MFLRAAVVAVLLPVCSGAAAQDACRAQLPDALVGELESHHTGFRVPLVSDNLPEDIAVARAAGGNGCLGVASADFDGDGGQDYAVALSGRDGKAGRIVVALHSSRAWRLHQLVDWATGRQRLYVETVDAGVHYRFSGFDAPLSASDRARGERSTMTCKHPGVMLGATESSGIVFCRLDGAWPYVWVSD